MNNKFFQTTFKSARTDLIKTPINAADFMPYSPHSAYVFGGNSGSLSSVINDKTLTAASPSTTSYTSDSVIIGASIGKHLLSDVTDSGDVTIIAILKKTTSLIQILIGNLEEFYAGTSSSFGVYRQSTNNTISTQLNYTTKQRGITGIAATTINSALAEGAVYTIAISINKTTKQVIIYHKDSLGAEQIKDLVFTGTYAATGTNIALGNSSYVGNITGNTEFKAATFYTKALTLDEIKAATTVLETRTN